MTFFNMNLLVTKFRALGSLKQSLGNDIKDLILIFFVTTKWKNQVINESATHFLK